MLIPEPTRPGARRTRYPDGTVGSALLVAILVAGGTSPADWSEYRPGRLGEFTARVPADAIVLDSVRIRVRLEYSGEFRPLSSEAGRHLSIWAGAMGVPNAPGAFAREVKVVEGGSEYWLPVQDILVEPMQAELKPGDEMEAFVVFIGASAGRPRFLLNEFRADGSDGGSR